MSQDVHTRPPEPKTRESIDGLDGLDGGPSVSTSDVLERLWRFFISMRTGLMLILALGLMSLIGTLLDQAPPGMSADPAGYASWLEGLKPKYGGWTTVLNKIEVKMEKKPILSRTVVQPPYLGFRPSSQLA